MTVFKQSTAAKFSASFLGDHPLTILKQLPTDISCYLLHSGRYHPTWANRSLFSSPICVYQFLAAPLAATGQSRLIPICAQSTNQLELPQLTNEPLADLRALFKLPGRWIGNISYELGQFLEPRGLRHQPPDGWPVIELGYCPVIHEYDLKEGTWQRWQATDCDELPWEACVKSTLATQASAPQAIDQAATARLSSLTAMPRDRYESQVRQIQAYIAAGDIFQANLSQRFETIATLELADSEQFRRQLACRLFENASPWYGSYLNLVNLNPDEPPRTLISSSPELFLQTQQMADDKVSVITRPIKGTAPNDGQADRKVELLKSDKDQAELNMIVDLMRNDIGRVCDPGTVQVTCSREIETHPTVHHGVATIKGQLNRNKDMVDLIAATVPGGSITGAPKIRAMEIIDELESVARGPYTGITGIFSLDGQQSAINIRQMQLTEHENKNIAIRFYVGAGIVSDSMPDKEYEETITKSRTMKMALSRMNFTSEGLSLG